MNDEGRPGPVVVDSWREENPLGSFSKETAAAPLEVALDKVTAAEPVERVRRSKFTVFGLAALGLLAVSVTTFLNSAVAPSPTPTARQALVVNHELAAAPVPKQIGSAGQSPQTEVAIEPADVSQPVPNEPTIKGVTTSPVALLNNSVAAARSFADVVKTPSVAGAREQSAADREAIDPTPARLPEPPIETLAFGAPTPIPIAPPTVADVRPSALAPPTASPPVSAAGRSAVADVLQRYAAAFGSLDVGEVKAVWPDVNEGALTRAFSTLQEQRFDLGECDIWVTGASAVASCAGRASYTPKIGNRKPRSEAREWTFYLRQEGPQWSIGTVRTR